MSKSMQKRLAVQTSRVTVFVVWSSKDRIIESIWQTRTGAEQELLRLRGIGVLAEIHEAPVRVLT